ncbi:MAG: beta-lactamase family protein, partial [Cellvibrionaceae bacterium]|nr:beta-lactamase family protein [Cellvibrionaceae bacterium]
MNSQLLHITKTMLDAAMGDYIKRDIIPCCSYSLQRGDTILLQSSLGWQDRQAQQALRDDGIFRIYSSTKLMSSVVAMQLIERGKLALEQPVAEFIPSYAELSVLRPEAQDINDCEPLQQAMTVRHLLSHSAGFSYGFVDPAGLVDQAYLGGGLNLLKPYPGNLDDFVRQLGQFPLVFQPGSDWRYSLATDVLGYILEAVS